MGKFTIDKKLLPMKAHYFLFNGGTAPLMPYIPVYARQLGIPGTGVGLMYAILPFIGLIAKPTLGALADKLRARKIIFTIAIAFSAVFFCCISFIPKKTIDVYVNLDCSSMTLLKRCGIIDNCTLARINLDSQEKNTLTCNLHCPFENNTFLNEICNTWDINDACSDVTALEFKTYSNMSKGLLEHSCLYFPVDKIQYNNFTIQHPYCNSSSTAKCRLSCEDAVVGSYLGEPREDEAEVPYYLTIQFQLLFAFMIGSWASQAVVVSIADSLCFSLLGDKPSRYGHQRLWGALGWGVFAMLSGYFIDLASLGKPEKDYTPSYILVAIILAINVLCALQIKIQYHEEPNIVRDVSSIFKDISVLLYLFSCISFGVCIGLVWQFLFWYLEDTAASQSCDSLQWIKLLQGLSMGIDCFLGEAPFLFISGWIIKKIGHVHTMTMILTLMGVRLLAYSFLSNPWLVLPIELLNGFTLGLYWAAMASFASLISPPGAASTVQGIFGALFEGIGTSIGSLVGGNVYERYGGVVTFRSYGIFALGAALVFSISNFIIRQRQSIRKGINTLNEHRPLMSTSPSSLLPNPDDP